MVLVKFPIETNQPVLRMSMQTSAAFAPCDFEEKVTATNAIQFKEG